MTPKQAMKALAEEIKFLSQFNMTKILDNCPEIWYNRVEQEKLSTGSAICLPRAPACTYAVHTCKIPEYQQFVNVGLYPF